MARGMKVALVGALLVAAAAAAAYFGHESYQRQVALAKVVPIVRQVSVRLSESLALERAPGVTFKELFDRMERYVGATDDKILELRTMDASRISEEHQFVLRYAELAQAAWRSKSAVYQTMLSAQSSHKWAMERMSEFTGSSGYGRDLNHRMAAKAVTDAREAVLKFDIAQIEHVSALRALQETLKSPPQALALSDLANVDNLKAAADAVVKEEVTKRQLSLLDTYERMLR